MHAPTRTSPGLRRGRGKRFRFVRQAIVSIGRSSDARNGRAASAGLSAGPLLLSDHARRETKVRDDQLAALHGPATERMRSHGIALRGLLLRGRARCERQPGATRRRPGPPQRGRSGRGCRLAAKQPSQRQTHNFAMKRAPASAIKRRGAVATRPDRCAVPIQDQPEGNGSGARAPGM